MNKFSARFTSQPESWGRSYRSHINTSMIDKDTYPIQNDVRFSDKVLYFGTNIIGFLLQYRDPLLYVWLQLVHGLLNIATTTKIRPPVDRSVYVMTHEATTAAWDWILAEIQHRPVSARYRRFGRIFGHGSTLRPKIEFQVWKLFLHVVSSNVSNF